MLGEARDARQHGRILKGNGLRVLRIVMIATFSRWYFWVILVVVFAIWYYYRYMRQPATSRSSAVVGVGPGANGLAKPRAEAAFHGC